MKDLYYHFEQLKKYFGKVERDLYESEEEQYCSSVQTQSVYTSEDDLEDDLEDDSSQLNLDTSRESLTSEE